MYNQDIKTNNFHILIIDDDQKIRQLLKQFLENNNFMVSDVENTNQAKIIMNSLIENQNGSNPLLEIVLKNDNYLSLSLLFLTTTILAPLFEEIIFRGVLLPILSRDFGVILGILISAFIFAIAHLSISEMPPLLVLGIGLGVTRMASGSLLSSVLMHSLWNGLTFFNLFLLRT